MKPGIALLILSLLAGSGCKKEPARDSAQAIERCITESEKDLKGACPGDQRPCADNQTQAKAQLTLISCHKRLEDRWVETSEKSVLRHQAMIMFIASRSEEGGVDCWFVSKKEWELLDESVAKFVKKWAKCTRIREEEWF